ncbi:MAG: N-6 DNA methylase, partial [Selenomonadaceae bacterium]|nr:N-6 DNA methylase [Selenomonadaceae bacterium]
FGYVIIPVIVPLDKSPEIFLAESKDFSVVYDVLNALRAHDDAMDVEFERIRNNGSSEKIIIDGGKPPFEHADKSTQISLEFLLRWDDVKNKMYARIVEHLGNKLYWIQWAEKIKNIVERHTKRIHEIISVKSPAQNAFNKFLQSLQKNLNPSVTKNDAVDMLAQHLVTRPVFEALFGNKSFAQNNPVSIAMQKILDELDKDGMNKDHEVFEKLYNQVRDQCNVTDNPKTKQEIITRLYDSFFRLALPTTAQKLGIVYTPVEVVDFILNSVNDVLQKNFGKTFSNKNVHILDPFTGTGTFITRLIQSGLIDKKILPYKYQNEIHANEIVLLAYYIAAVNIENTFNSANLTTYLPYNLICFTDTFQTYENDENTDTQTAFYQLRGPLEKNSERINNQLEKKIQIIIGNPPYSVGQRSANDNAQNNYYAKIEQKISETYAANTQATNKNSLYDSYIKAFRWASERIKDGGIIGFVTNAGWLDGAAMDGLRKCFVKEFSEIYVFNLRGNQRTQGEISRREGGKIFGSGSRAPIAITILVKNNSDGDAKIFYCDIGDYLNREQKLSRIAEFKSVLNE